MLQIERFYLKSLLKQLKISLIKNIGNFCRYKKITLQAKRIFCLQSDFAKRSGFAFFEKLKSRG